MKRIAIFLGLCISASAGVFKIGPEIGTIGQPYWSSVYDTVVWEAPSCQIQIPDGVSYGYGTNALGETLPAGTYYIHSRIWTYVYPGVVVFSIGDGTATNTFTSTQSWLTRQQFVSSVPFSNVVARFTRDATVPAPTLHRYNWNAFYLTTNAQETIPTESEMDTDDNVFVDYTPPTDTQTTGLRSGNLVPNSSFEAGMAGWTWSAQTAKSITNGVWLNDALSTDEFYEGTTSVEINQFKARYQLLSPVIRLRSDRIARPHTLSFWAKQNTNVALTVTLAHTVPNTTGYSNSVGIVWTLTPSSSWTRYSYTTNLAGIPTPEVAVDFTHVGGELASVWIDAVQLEEGSTATDYAPLGGIEFALLSGRNGSLFDVGESVALSLVTHNPATALSATFYSETRDFWNAVVDTQTNTFTLTAKQTNTLQIPVTKRGSYRTLTWTTARKGWVDESTWSIAQIGAPDLGTNQVIGTHMEYAGPLLSSNAAFGISWTRSFGSGAFIWSSIEPTEGAFAWSTPDLTFGVASNKAISLGNLQWGSPASWAVTSSYPRLDRVYLYTSNIVARYKGSVKYWEDWNEPQYTYSAAQYAGILEQTATAVKDADATAFLCGMGGATTVAFASNVWSALSVAAQGKIDAIAVHLYPKGDRWMDPDTDSRFQDFRTWADSIGKPLWNTESGSWETGIRKGQLVGLLGAGEYYFDFWREQPTIRSVFQATPATMKSALRTVGWGGKFFQYDSYKQFYNWRNINTEPTLIDYDDAARPLVPAINWANELLSGKTSHKSITNSLATAVEAYLFGTVATLAVFAQAKTNITLTTTNGEFAIYDLFGNLIQTNSTSASVSAWPTYWYSATLTTNQLAETFASASVADEPDTSAPLISIEESPRTGWSINTAEGGLFRWTAQDNTLANTDAYPTNVLTRFKLVGVDTDWSEWSGVRRSVRSTIPSGSYYISIQAKDAYGLATNQLDGPVFTIPGASATANTATVGMLIIGQ